MAAAASTTASPRAALNVTKAWLEPGPLWPKPFSPSSRRMSMPRPSLEHVRSQLLRAGFPPRHVNRYVRELQEHLADLVTREQSIGLTMQEAQAKACTLLGTDAQLVQAMIDRRPPRSLAAKAPWAVFG